MDSNCAWAMASWAITGTSTGPGFRPLEQHTVHGQHGFCIEVVSQSYSGLHRGDIAHDEVCVA